MAQRKVYWTSGVGGFDDFGDAIGDIIIDGKTNQGPWALMTPKSYELNCFHKNSSGMPAFGLGIAQKYEKQPDGKWLKIQG